MQENYALFSMPFVGHKLALMKLSRAFLNRLPEAVRQTQSEFVFNDLTGIYTCISAEAALSPVYEVFWFKFIAEVYGDHFVVGFPRIIHE